MPSAHHLTGFRRLTPGLLQADRAAERFDGLPDDVDHHGQLLAAVKAAARRIGISRIQLDVVDWLFRFTRLQDWEPDSRPIVWPSAALQQEVFGLSATRVKAINRGLIEAGLITMKDSPSGKRYGHRDKHGRITEAYGFDLSPLAARYPEFVQAAAEAKAEWDLLGRLRRRATIARKAITQILETVTEYGWGGEEWLQLRQDTQRLVQTARQAQRSEELTIAVGSLERRQTEARERLQWLLDSSYTDPKGSEYGPHTIPTKPIINPYQDTVSALERCNPQATPKPRTAPPDQAPSSPPPLSIIDLVRVAPRLGTYLTAQKPTWSDIVNAADWLRTELDISKPLWGEACLTMGREAAAVAVAIVSTKPVTHFRSTPGGYFHGMVAKAKAGELNLARTMWGLRQRR